MKQHFFLFAALTFTINSFGQLDKKTWLVGGSGSFYSYNGEYTSTANNNTTKVTNININASIGYFLIDKFVIGIRPSFFFNKGKIYANGNQVGQISDKNQLGVGPFVRYYFLEKDKAFNIFSDISYQFGKNISPLPPKENGIISEFSISTGAELFFNSSVGIEFLLGYKSKMENIKGASSYTDKKSGFQIGIGFQIHLQKL